jgi:hypothetical protein
MRPLNSIPILLKDDRNHARYEYRDRKIELRKPGKRWFCNGIDIMFSEARSASFSRERLLNRMCRQIDRQAKHSTMPTIISERSAVALSQAMSTTIPVSRIKVNTPC